VGEDELLLIGKFAQLSGLSVGTLRHYDEVRLLSPAAVDPSSGYRRYRRDQLQQAWQIRVLRWIELPIDEIRQVLGDPAAAPEVLARHRRRLERRRSLLDAQISEADRFVEEGVSMRSLTTGVHLGQIKIAVHDMAVAKEFYQNAFGFDYRIVRRTEETEYGAFVFGELGQDTFFMLVLLDSSERLDLPGPSTFGLRVEDLDVYHAQALAAGAIEAVKPHDPGGMPRCSAIRDPSGNWIWLYQA
jgi:DNA-binding transcriptional MerR regulator